MSDPESLPVSSSTWRAMVTPYLKPDWRHALIQLSNTGIMFLVVMAAIMVGVGYGFWGVLLLIPLPPSCWLGCLCFSMIAGMGSFFPARWANDLLGSVLGVVTLTPYKAWRGDHALHHAGTGNLDRRGIGDVTTLTLDEYVALPRRSRLAYRLYRHPLVLFGVGPAWQFLINQRIPRGHPIRSWRSWPVCSEPTLPC